MNVVLLLSVLGGFASSVSVVASTPTEAVERLARLEDAEGRAPILDARAFDGLPLPAAGVEFRATRRASRSSKLRVRIVATQGGRELARRDFAFAWRTKVAVVVPARDIARGEVVRQSDLLLKEIETRRETERLALAPEQLVGRIARAPLTKHHPVMLSDVTLPDVVKRNDRIEVRATFGELTVRLVGIALEDGAMGDTIDVRNEATKKRLAAVIVDYGVAEVNR